MSDKPTQKQVTRSYSRYESDKSRLDRVAQSRNNIDGYLREDSEISEKPARFESENVKNDKEISPYTDTLETDNATGFSNNKLKEKFPDYNASKSEKVIKGDNNTYIILGRDRQHTISTGYGGKGHTRSGAIDIVAGLQGWDPAEGGKFRGGKFIQGRAEKNFGSFNKDVSAGDAARIYISQRADIDDYFDICDGNVGRSYSDSAIAMKADEIRILARKGIKLVTQKNPPGRNSLDGKIGVVYGIDLIAGNRDTKTGLQGLSKGNPEYGSKRTLQYLQPIPKGDNLEEYLRKIHNNVQLLNSCVSGLLLTMPKLTKAVLSPKTVLGPLSAGSISIPNLPDILDVTSYNILAQKQFGKLSKARIDMLAYEIDYLHEAGAIYINSRYNRTN
jgi:hypothetical protein